MAKVQIIFNYSPTSSDSLLLLGRYFEMKAYKTWVIGINGKWLRRQEVIMIYRNVTNKVNLYYSYRPSKSYDSIEKDFEKFIPIIKDHLPTDIITD